MLWIKLHVHRRAHHPSFLGAPPFFSPGTHCHPSVKETSTWGPPVTTSPELSKRWSHTRWPLHPSTPAPFAMDVSKPSDLAVLTGGYFGSGMAKPSATHDGHRKKKEKKKKTRDCKEGVFAKESRGSSCVWVCGKHVCLCVCVRNQPYQRQSVVLGSCVAGDPRDRCWNQRFHSLAKLRRTLKFILWQLLVVSSAFPPHHDRHLGFITAKISHLCGCFCCSNSCADLHKLAHVVRAWFMLPLCPACGTFFFFFFFFLNKRIHLAWSSWLTKLPVLGAFRPFGNEPDQQVEQWNMPVSERGISVCLHLKHHLPLWNLTNASKKKKKTHTKKTFAGRRHESSSCLTLFKVAYKSWDAQYITLKLLSALGLL